MAAHQLFTPEKGRGSLRWDWPGSGVDPSEFCWSSSLHSGELSPETRTAQGQVLIPHLHCSHDSKVLDEASRSKLPADM